MFLWRYNVSSLEIFYYCYTQMWRKGIKREWKVVYNLTNWFGFMKASWYWEQRKKVSFFSTRKKKKEKVVKFNFVLSNWKLQEFSYIPHTVRKIPYSVFLLPPLEMHAKNEKYFSYFYKDEKRMKKFYVSRVKILLPYFIFCALFL